MQMKKILNYVILVAALIVAVTCITACSQWDTPYDGMSEDGYNISIRYDANGGMFAGTNDVTVVDVFRLEDAKTNENGEKEISLIAPDDEGRGQQAFSVTKNGHFLAGWYQERTPVMDGDVHLNYKGEPTTDEREYAYTYSGKWDFSKDTYTIDPNKTYDASEGALTLYAAWVPYFTFQVYVPGENGEYQLAKEQEGIEFVLPEWDDKTGKLDMKKFPTRTGYTLEDVYLDSALTEKVAEKITGTVDYETGTTSTIEPIRLYTTWREGTWFKITTVDQFIKNSRVDGCYEILADLDFQGKGWPSVFTGKTFTGKIIGNGHQMSNITAIRSDRQTKEQLGGLFGELAATAVIQDVVFENATYRIQGGSVVDAKIGLLAGNIVSGATLSDITISGQLEIGKSVNAYTFKGDWGLLCGYGTFEGIDISNIKCVAAEGNTNVNIEVDNGIITLTFIS